MITNILHTTVTFFFLFTPFAALSLFLYFTQDEDDIARRKASLKIGLSVFLICLSILAFGKHIFSALGITIDSFRVGLGVILLLDAISLSKDKLPIPDKKKATNDIIIVPMTIPLIVGPAVMGTMLVCGTEAKDFNEKLQYASSLLIACIFVTLLLLLAVPFKKFIGGRWIGILSKLTGLYLSAISANMIMKGLSVGLFSKM